MECGVASDVALVKNGGEVESLEKLKELTDYGKPLLSYHVQGAEDSQGLAELGLVEVRKGERGKERRQSHDPRKTTDARQVGRMN